MYSYVAGLQIDPKNPGYKHIIFNPHPGGGLTHAKAQFESLYGTVKSAWKIEGNRFLYEVVIPSNTAGTVILNTTEIDGLKMNSQVLNSKTKDSIKKVNHSLEIALGSGSYQFEFPMKK
uniref:alpha-L-rhamnosidase C-terminal domain-containing protein n=1 Tax=Mariniflexile sp. TaxID=1979402 RepID=UPI004048C24C